MPGAKAPEDERREAILRSTYAVAAETRLTGLTVERVAREAGVSKGLVFFYFATKGELLVALLDWLLARTIVAPEVEALIAGQSPGERFFAAVQRDIERLPAQRERVELFFDFWVMGTRESEVRRRIRSALSRYRDAYRPLAEAAVAADPERFAGMSSSGLAAVATSFVTGCALQAVMDPRRFDVDEYMGTLRALVARGGG